MIVSGLLLWFVLVGVIILFFRGAFPRHDDAGAVPRPRPRAGSERLRVPVRPLQ